MLSNPMLIWRLAIFPAGEEVMKSSLLLAAMLLIASGAEANITRTQSVTGSGSGTTCTATFGSTTAAHDLIVVWSFWQSSTLTASVADSLANTYGSAVGPTTRPGASGGNAQIFFAKNVAGGTDTVTVTYSGSTTACNVVAADYSGADQNSPLDAVAANTGNSSALDSGSATPSFANEVVFVGGSADAGTVSVGNGFSPVQTSGGNVVEDDIRISNIGQQHATASLTSSANWVMQVATFRDTATTLRGSLGIVGPRPYYDATAYGASGSYSGTTGSMSSSGHILTLASAIDFANGQGIAVFGAGSTPTISTPASPTVSQTTAFPQIALASDVPPGATCSGTTATISTRGYNGLSSGESVTIGNVKSGGGTTLSAYNITAIITVVNRYQFTYTIASCPGSGGSLTEASPASLTLNAGSTTYNYEVAAVDANSGLTAATAPGSVSSANPVTGPQVYNGLSWPRVTNATMYSVYRKINSGSYTCIGTAIQPGQTNTNPSYKDYGGTSGSCPVNSPSTPPSSAVNQILLSTIASGAGTTSLTLASSAGTNVSGVVVQHDDTAAINAAIAAAAANSLVRYGGGGNVLLPGPATYYVQTLSFPTTTPNGSASMAIRLSGQILNRQPLLFKDVANYSLIGESGGTVTAGQEYAAAFVGGIGVAPAIGIQTANSIRIENIGTNYCTTDCIRIDTDNAGGPALITLKNVNENVIGGQPGSALHCTNYDGSVGFPFGIYVTGGAYGASLDPSILFENCGIIHGEEVYNNGTGIEWVASNGPGISDFTWDNGYSEGVTTPQFIVDTSHSIHAYWMSISNFAGADPSIGADLTLLKVLGRYTGIVTITGGISYGAGAFDPRILDGTIEAFNITAACVTYGCTGTSDSFFGNPSPGSGVFFDNQGNTFEFRNDISPGTSMGSTLGTKQPWASVTSGTYSTASNCKSSASPAVCGSAAAGAVAIAAGSSSVVVDTTAVTANSDISLTFNSSLGTRLSVTCNTTAQQPTVSAISAGTSFTISVSSSFSTNPGCISYSIVN
jgi:hypothetical protein